MNQSGKILSRRTRETKYQIGMALGVYQCFMLHWLHEQCCSTMTLLKASSFRSDLSLLKWAKRLVVTIAFPVFAINQLLTDSPQDSLTQYSFCDLNYTIQWNLSITALQIKDTSIIRTPINSPKRSAIETCTYLTSELRTPLYSVLQTLDPVPNGHIAQLMNSIIQSRPRPRVRSLALAVQFHMDYHEDG